MLLKVATLVLIPSLIVQGSRVNKNTLRLAEAAGDRTGVSGSGRKLSLLILGDSAAAGVGVAHQQDALLGSILQQLAQDFEIHWTLEAKTGHTTTQVLEKLQQMPAQHFDVVITSVGVNDVTKLTPPQRWIEQQQQFYQQIQQKFKPQLIVAAGVPPLQKFPALPNPLGWLFGQYAKQMNLRLNQLAPQLHNMHLIEYDLEQYARLNLSMARDGFHPSKEIYQLWGSAVAEKIQQYCHV